MKYFYVTYERLMPLLPARSASSRWRADARPAESHMPLLPARSASCRWRADARPLMAPLITTCGHAGPRGISLTYETRDGEHEFRRLGSSISILNDPIEQIAYQHTVFCQTCLPYKSVEGRIWERRQGAVFLSLEAGRIRKPGDTHYFDIGLPYGSRPRLIMAHLNREALLRGSPKIEVEASLKAFIRRVIKGEWVNSREMNRFKDQLTRFASAMVRMSVDLPDNKAYQINTQIIDAMELWLTKDERQRVLWPAYVELSPRYFESLAKHAVPLDERAIAALSNSPMALDVYAWLAQRLVRVAPTKPQFVPWTALKEQFGFGFGRMDNFKAGFKPILSQVTGQYPKARLEADDRGLTLIHSSPPVPSYPCAFGR